MQEKKKYNVTFGILSAIGILCVVMGHMGCALLSVDNWFPYYSFHIHLFMFISGYFVHTYTGKQFPGKRVLKRAGRLLVPFVFWNLFYLTLQTVLNKVWGCTIGNTLSLYNLVIQPFTSDQPYGFNAPSWFLLALFLTEIYDLLLRWGVNFLEPWMGSDRNRIAHGLLLVCGGLSAAAFLVLRSSECSGLRLIVLRSLYLLFFYELGHWYRMWGEERDRLKSTLCFVLIFVVQYILRFRYEDLSLHVYNCDNFGSFVPGYLTPVLGIAFWLRVSRILTPVLGKVSWFMYIGRHTMEIMIHHLGVLFVLRSFLALLHKYTPLFPDFNMGQHKAWAYYLYEPAQGVHIFYVGFTIAVILGVVKAKNKIINRH